jgi:hypothetical protein
MAPNLQTKQYGYIELASQRAMQGVTQAIGAYEAHRQTKIDTAQVESIRKQRIEEAAKEYMEATGEDERKAYAYVSQTYYKPTGNEVNNPELAIQRMDKDDGTFYKKLADLKKKRYFNEAEGENIGIQYDRPMGQASAGNPTDQPPQRQVTPTTPEQAQGNRSADTSRLSAAPQSLGEMQSQALYSPRTMTEVNTPPPSATERQSLANKYGLGSDQNVQTNIEQASASELAGRNFEPGTTKESVVRAAAEQPAYPKISQDLANSYPTQQQQATNKRLTETSKDKLAMQQEALKAKKWQISLQGKKMSANEAIEINKALALAQTNKQKLLLQAKSIEARLTTANKQGFDKELDQEAIQQQIENLNDIYESINNNTDAEDTYRLLLKNDKNFKEANANNPAPKVTNNDPLGIR